MPSETTSKPSPAKNQAQLSRVSAVSDWVRVCRASRIPPATTTVASTTIVMNRGVSCGLTESSAGLSAA